MRRAAVPLALALTFPAMAQDDAIERGEQLFVLCSACHSIMPGEDGLQGPNLAAILGSRAGSRPNFPYTDVFVGLREDGVVWTAETLDLFLADPLAFAPGNAMGPVGVSRTADRADLITYLEAVSASNR